MTSTCSHIAYKNKPKQYNNNTYFNSTAILITDHLYLKGIIHIIVECTTMSNVTMGQKL